MEKAGLRSKGSYKRQFVGLGVPWSQGHTHKGDSIPKRTLP